MAAVTVQDAAMLTDAVRTEMYETTKRELDFDVMEDCIVAALNCVDKNKPLMTKLISIATHSFLFGYYTALEDFQALQRLFIDAASKGELETDDKIPAAQAACIKAEGRESDGDSNMGARG